MKQPPAILITAGTDRKGAEFADSSLSLSFNYTRAIKAGGGLPWVLPTDPDPALVAEGVRRSDGVLLTGGDDVQPSLYTRRLPPQIARTVHPAGPERDAFEVLLIQEVLRQRKPLLAICRGHQILNVALGGTLFADIPQQVPQALNHSRTDRKDQVVHSVTVAPGTLMARIAGKPRLGVNSSHHQAVAALAKPLQATAVSEDGVVEGLELTPASARMLPFLLAVQFHPERLFARHAEHLALFKTFIRACARRR